MSEPEVVLAPGRSCAGCTMCCKVMIVAELAKPAGRWCTHCDIGKGCRIYPERPHSCAAFHCIYLLNPTLREYWKPAHSRMVVTRDTHRVNILVDMDRPDAWRKEPYYADLKKWSASFAARQTMVIVSVGSAMTAVLPDRDIDIGDYRADRTPKLVGRLGPQGVHYDIEIVDVPEPPEKT